MEIAHMTQLLLTMRQFIMFVYVSREKSTHLLVDSPARIVDASLEPLKTKGITAIEFVVVVFAAAVQAAG